MPRHSEEYPGQYGPPTRPLTDDEYYGPAREVALTVVKQQRQRKQQRHVARSTWSNLFVELALRLEQTDAHHALEIQVCDEQRLMSALTQLRRQFGRLGRGYARILVRRNPPRLYVARGKGWYKLGGMALPEEKGEENVS